MLIYVKEILERNLKFIASIFESFFNYSLYYHTSLFNIYIFFFFFFAVDYEIEPIEFEYKDDPLLNQDTDDENV
jgi:hypothetical protein